MDKQQSLKILAAEAAIQEVPPESLIGVGTGSTVLPFIHALKKIKHQIEGAVPSSLSTEALLREAGIPIVDPNTISELPLYVDGADECNEHHQLIKGGGGALTREKILATCAKKFICIVDESKCVKNLGDHFPVAIEVIPFARSFVARELVKLGGSPSYRDGFKTDNGNCILDVYHLDLSDPSKMETQINTIPGVIENGIFSHRRADKIIIGTPSGLKYQ